MMSAERAVERGKSGVYRVHPGKTGEVERLTRASGLSFHRVDVSGAAPKAAILAALSSELRFPDWFGDNWDALQDALCDLSWLPGNRGIVLIVEGSEAVRAAAPGEFETFLEVLRSAARYWEKEGRPFLVLVTGRSSPRAPRP